MKKKTQRFYGWMVLATGALALFFEGGSSIYAFGLFLPLLCKDFGWSRGAASMGMFFTMGFMLLGSPLAGFFMGKFGVRVSMPLGNLLIAVSLCSLAFLSQLWHLYLAYALVGAGLALASNVAGSTLAANWFVKHNALANGVVIGSQSVGGLLLLPFLVVLIGRMGWRSTYLVLGGLVFVFASIVPALFLRNKPEDLGQFQDGVDPSLIPAALAASHSGLIQETTVNFTLKEALRTPAFWFLAICNDLPICILVFLNTHQVAFLLGRGFTMQVAAFTISVMSVAALAGTLGMGILSLKFNVRKLAILAGALMIVGMTLALMLTTTSALQAYTYSVMFGLGYGLIMVAVATLMAQYYGKANYSKIFGVAIFFQLMSTLSAPLGGFIYDAYKSYDRAFMIFLAAAVFCFISMICLRRPSHPPAIRNLASEGHQQALTV